LENSQSEICPNCGEFVLELNPITGFCFECSPVVASYSVSSWLATNGDALDHYIAQGNDLARAIDKVYNRVRPTCVVCAKPISHAPRTAIFCRRTRECRRYSRRYIYLYTRKGLSKTEALAIVLEQLANTMGG
jgi:hypothetical protein